MKYQFAPEDEPSMGPLNEQTLNIYLVRSAHIHSWLRVVQFVPLTIWYPCRHLIKTCIYTPDWPWVSVCILGQSLYVNAAPVMRVDVD